MQNSGQNNGLLVSRFSLGFGVFVSFFLAGASSFASTELQPQMMLETSNRCHPIRGRIKTEITQEHCGSQIMCTAGKMTGSGLLRGTTFYTAAGVGPNVLDPALENSLSYTGNLTIRTLYGDVKVTDLGILHKTQGLFSELSVNLSGTGLFKNATGKLFFYGLFLGTGFSGDVGGEICL